MTERNSTLEGLVWWILAVVISVGLVGGGLLWADSRYREIVDNRAKERMANLLENGTLPVYRVDTLPDVDREGSWDGLPSLEVAMAPQMMAMPMLDTASVRAVRVTAATDGREIVWLLTWQDEDPDQNVDVGRFTDAVAVQFPLVQNAPFTMGAKDQPVQILHWKGVWQKDVDEHFQDVVDLHPNYWADLYWFASGGFPFRVPDAFADTASHAWFPAWKAGNPMTDFFRKIPVEELSAVGFGTLTHQRKSVTTGKARWKDGRWTVEFRRPLRTDDPMDYQFYEGTRGAFSVAVWDGGAGNVGGRKHYSLWVPFEVQS